jgi:hypothetical protein
LRHAPRGTVRLRRVEVAALAVPRARRRLEREALAIIDLHPGVGPAEELIVLTRPDEEVDWLEEGSGEEAQKRLSLPVTHLVVEE